MSRWRLAAVLVLGGFLIFLVLTYRYLQYARPSSRFHVGGSAQKSRGVRSVWQ